MKLTEEEVKEIMIKVFKDLNLQHNDKYPMTCFFYEKDEDYDFDYWAGAYDYRNHVAAGEELSGRNIEYGITINDETGLAVEYGHYTGHYKIKLDDDGKYVILKRI